MWWIILIIVAVLIVAGLIVGGGRRARERQLEGKREEAGDFGPRLTSRRPRPASAPRSRRSRPTRPSRSAPRPRKLAAARTTSIQT
jgi:hypothetical protein